MKIKPTLNDKLLEEVRRCREVGRATPRLMEMFLHLASEYLSRPQHQYLVNRDDMISYTVEQLMKFWPRIKLEKLEPDNNMYGVLMTTVCGAMIYYAAKKKKNPAWRT